MSTQVVPTLFSFFGPAPAYLQYALKSAADLKNEVVLIGDQANREAWKNHWDSSHMPVPKFDAFSRVFRKMSAYPDFYETSFWRRPFVVEQWMKHEGVEEVFVLDGDVVTFADYSRDVLPTLPLECAAGLMTAGHQREFEWATSLHFSYWTRAALESFTSFLIEAYSDKPIRAKLEAKYKWHVMNGQPGGICEMTLLYLWRERYERQTWNFARAWNGMVGDLAIGTSDNYVRGEYQMRRGLKQLTFENDVPFGYNLFLDERVRFLCAHCQGQCKDAMRFLCRRNWRRVYGDAYRLHGRLASAKTKAATVLMAAKHLVGSAEE